MSRWFRCKIEGISKEQAKTYLTENSDGYAYFDFRKIVPVPEHLQSHNGLSLNDGLEMVKRRIMALEFLKLLNIRECSACNNMTDMFSDWLEWAKENGRKFCECVKTYKKLALQSCLYLQHIYIFQHIITI